MTLGELFEKAYKECSGNILPEEKLDEINKFLPGNKKWFTKIQIIPTSEGDTLIGSNEENGMIFLGVYKGTHAL